MNLDDAVAAHVDWKNKLAAYLNKPDHSLKRAEVEPDDRCALGKWLKGEGNKYSMLPEFSKVTAEHARFHKAADDVIRKADSGGRVGK